MIEPISRGVLDTRLRGYDDLTLLPSPVIASAAKQSMAPQKGRMDCFAALAMTWRELRHTLSPHPEEAAKAVSKGPNAPTAESS